MAYTAEPRYTTKLDAMIEPDMGAFIQRRAEELRISKSSVVREMLALGKDVIERLQGVAE